MFRYPIPGALVLALLTGSALAQQSPPVYTVRIDDGPHCDGEDPNCVDHHVSELALRASPSTFDIIAAWHEHPRFPFSRVNYNVSIDGKSFRTLLPPTVQNPHPENRVPLPSCWTDYQGADPSVTFMQDGTGWIGHLGEYSPNTFLYDRLWIAKKNPGAQFASTASPSIAPSTEQVDKDVIAAGPPRQGDGDVLGAFFVMQPRTTGQQALPRDILSPPQFDYCTPPPPPITIVDMAHVQGEYPAPNAAVILRDAPGSPLKGRWVVGQYHLTPARPWAQYSDNSGQSQTTWHPSISPTSARKADAAHLSEVETIDWSQSWQAPKPAYFEHYPLLAFDPNAPSKVYMAFTGRSPSESSSNIDIFIAQSTEGGVDFSGDTGLGAGKNVIRLTDYDLGDDLFNGALGPAVQFFPNIAVDQWGTLHVMYYVGWKNWDSLEWIYKVRLAHIPNFDVTQRPTVTTVDLTSYFFSLNDPSMALWTQDRGGRPFIGDYINALDVRGCEVIGGYIAPPEDGGPAGVFVSFTLIPNSTCVIDPNCYANCDGTTVAPILNANDFLCFLNRYAAGESYANCDGSTVAPVLNANDFQCFLNKYSAGCT